jgi:hypothetical protein
LVIFIIAATNFNPKIALFRGRKLHPRLFHGVSTGVPQGISGIRKKQRRLARSGPSCLVTAIGRLGIGTFLRAIP